MKKINLDTQLKMIDGTPILLEDKMPFIIKNALVNCLGVHQSRNGEEAIKAYDLGLKIYNTKKEIELEDEEIKFLIDVVSNNKQYVSIITAQVLKYLKGD